MLFAAGVQDRRTPFGYEIDLRAFSRGPVATYVGESRIHCTTETLYVDKRAFMLGVNEKVYAFDRTTRQQRYSHRMPSSHGCVSAMTIMNGVLYVGSETGGFGMFQPAG